MNKIIDANNIDFSDKRYISLIKDRNYIDTL